MGTLQFASICIKLLNIYQASLLPTYPLLYYSIRLSNLLIYLSVCLSLIVSIMIGIILYVGLFFLKLYNHNIKKIRKIEYTFAIELIKILYDYKSIWIFFTNIHPHRFKKKKKKIIIIIIMRRRRRRR